MLAIRTILHPTDFSESSERAFVLACALARDYDARLVVVHVAPVAVVGYGEGFIPPPPEAYLKPLRERLHEIGPTDPRIPVEHRLVEGDAAAEIVRLAGQIKADLVVLGTHGRSGLNRLLMGSVAEHVLRRAPCPVVTVKMAPPATPSPKGSGVKAAGEAVAV